MAYGAHGAPGWVASDDQPDGEHEGPGDASKCGDRGTERNLRPDPRSSKSSRSHVLQRARRRSARPRPAGGFELLKQGVIYLEEQQRRDAEALRRLERKLQGSGGYDGIGPKDEAGMGGDLRVASSLLARKYKVFGTESTSLEAEKRCDMGVTSPHIEHADFQARRRRPSLGGDDGPARSICHGFGAEQQCKHQQQQRTEQQRRRRQRQRSE